MEAYHCDPLIAVEEVLAYIFNSMRGDNYKNRKRIVQAFAYWRALFRWISQCNIQKLCVTIFQKKRFFCRKYKIQRRQ